LAIASSPLEIRFSPFAQFVRQRLLPVPGEVLVHVGDRVQADDIVAQASLEGRLQTLDLAEALGVSVNSLSRRLLVSEGQVVAEGAPLVRRRWPWEQAVRSPISGVVQGIVDGRLVIRQEPELLRLRAYLPGEIVEVYPHRGVAIRGTGVLVRGIWGCGEEAQGHLMMTANSPADVLTLEKVSLRYRGMVLVGGILEDVRVLLRARRFRVKGLIVGSILPGLRGLCERYHLPVVVTEGVGRIPMAEPIFELLREYQGKLAVISGVAQDGRSAPEVIVPLPDEGQASALMVVRPIEVGARVRLVRPPFVGVIGQVVAIPMTPQETLIGTRLPGAEVRLGDGRRVFVPYVNMELL